MSSVKKVLPKTTKLASYQIEAITKAAISVSRKNISVVDSKSTQAYNTSKSIHLPFSYILENEEEVLKWIDKNLTYFTYDDMYALALHEGMHSFLHSFNGKDFGEKACPENKKFGHMMFNLAEDSRIDYVGRELHPGWAYDLKNLDKRILSSFFKEFPNDIDYNKNDDASFDALLKIVMAISADTESLIDAYIPECRKNRRVCEIIAQSKKIFSELWNEPTLLQSYVTTKKLVEMFRAFLKREKNFAPPNTPKSQKGEKSEENSGSSGSGDSDENQEGGSGGSGASKSKKSKKNTKSKKEDTKDKSGKGGSGAESDDETESDTENNEGGSDGKGKDNKDSKDNQEDAKGGSQGGDEKEDLDENSGNGSGDEEKDTENKESDKDKDEKGDGNKTGEDNETDEKDGKGNAGEESDESTEEEFSDAEKSGEDSENGEENESEKDLEDADESETEDTRDLSEFDIDEPESDNPTIDDRKNDPDIERDDKNEIKAVERIVKSSDDMTSEEIEEQYKEIKETMKDEIKTRIQNEKDKALRPKNKPENLNDPADYTSEAVSTVDRSNRAKEIYCDIRKGLNALKKENRISNPEEILKEILDENNPLILNLQANFEKISASVEWKSGKRSGRLDARKITRLITDPKDDKLFQKKEYHEGADVIVLVDESGSMGGDKIDAAREAAVVISKALENTRINFCIAGFGAGGEDGKPRIVEKQYKVFGENLDLRRVAAIGVSYNYGENRDGTSIRHVARHFKDTKPTNKKILIVISDGQPSHCVDGYSGIHAQKDTANAIREVRKNGAFVFAISIDQSSYADTYLMPAYGLGNYFKCSPATLKDQLKKFGIRIAQAIF